MTTTTKYRGTFEIIYRASHSPPYVTVDDLLNSVGREERWPGTRGIVQALHPQITCTSWDEWEEPKS